MWRIKPAEYARLLTMGLWPALGFLLLSPLMAAASVGLFRRRRWAWWLAVVIFAVNATADALRGASGAYIEGAIGVAATVLVLWWLTRPRVRALFR
jgi:hypothetical protein